jgi:hypothetical protein
MEALLVALDAAQDADDPMVQAWALEVLKAAGVVVGRPLLQTKRSEGVSKSLSWLKPRKRSRANALHGLAHSASGHRDRSVSSCASWFKRHVSSSYSANWGY